MLFSAHHVLVLHSSTTAVLGTYALVLHSSTTAVLGANVLLVHSTTTVVFGTYVLGVLAIGILAKYDNTAKLLHSSHRDLC